MVHVRERAGRRCRFFSPTGKTFEEKRDWHSEDLRQVLHAPRADAVHSLLVFLELLECHSEAISEFGLAYIEHEPARLRPATDTESASGKVWVNF